MELSEGGCDVVGFDPNEPQPTAGDLIGEQL